MPRTGACFQAKDYLEHILARWSDACVAHKIQERNDGREKEFKRIYKRTNTPGIDYGNYGGAWRRSTGPHEVVGGDAGRDFACRRRHSPGARFQSKPEARL